MSGFAVVRHPEVEALGILPQGALTLHRANGWIRVSPWADQPADLHLSDYAESYVDLDAEPKHEQPASPAAPERDEEQS